MKQPLNTRTVTAKYKGLNRLVLQEYRKKKKRSHWHTIALVQNDGTQEWFKGRCTLCGQKVLVAKVSNDHHLSYENDTTIFLCFTCHNVFHWRMQFKSGYWKEYEKKYGEDFFAFFLCHAILKIFYKHPNVIAEIKRRFPEVKNEV